MFEEDRVNQNWTATDDKKKVLEDHMKEARLKQVKTDENLPTEDPKKYQPLFGRARKHNYYSEFMQKNIASIRENDLSIIVWPWASWIIGTVAILAAVFLILYSKHAKVWTKTLLVVVIVMVVIGIVFLLFSAIEIFEGDRAQKVFIIRRVAVCTGKVHKLKWSQIKNVDVVMAGHMDKYNNSIHYRIEFESVTNSRIRCLETSDRKKAKERLILIKMTMGREIDTDDVQVQNKTANHAELLEKQRQITIKKI